MFTFPQGHFQKKLEGLFEYDRGLRIDGSRYVSFPSNPNFLNSISDAYSIAFVINLLAFDVNNNVVQNYNAGVNDGLLIQAGKQSGGLFYIAFYAATTNGAVDSNYGTFTIQEPASNLLHVVCCKHAGANASLNTCYSNNKPMVGSGYINNAGGTINKGQLHIGAIANVSMYSNCIIYDMKIFNKKLSASEVNDLYTGTALPSGLVANWTFDQSNGATLIDSSGNSLNGNLVNYSTPEISLGGQNKWVDKFGNPILI